MVTVRECSIYRASVQENTVCKYRVYRAEVQTVGTRYRAKVQESEQKNERLRQFRRR